MVDTLQSYMVAAIAIEGLISWSQTFIVDKKFQWQILVSLGLSFLLVIDLKLNLFTVLEINESYPWVGICLTAISISRGTNYFYELYSRLINWKEMKAE
jgi:hypothetical protein